MFRVIKTEFLKLRRYFILWIGVSLMLLTVLVTLFTSLAEDGMVWDFLFLYEQQCPRSYRCMRSEDWHRQ